MRNTKEGSGYSVGEVKSGKYVRILLKVVNDKIEEISIIGDFFAFPETSIDSLEKDLIGKTLEEALSIIDRYEISLVGITKEDLKNALRRAFEGS